MTHYFPHKVKWKRIKTNESKNWPFREKQKLKSNVIEVYPSEIQRHLSLLERLRIGFFFLFLSIVNIFKLYVTVA